jgi:hypothetical protein
MPQARLRQQVVGLGLKGRRESNDSGEKQHLGSTLATQSLKINASFLKSVMWLSTYRRLPQPGLCAGLTSLQNDRNHKKGPELFRIRGPHL